MLLFETLLASNHPSGPINNVLYSWGFNGNGELGIGTSTNVSSPIQVGSSSWKQISSGTINTMALRNDGIMFVWGDNTYGQLANGLYTGGTTSSPIQVGSSLSWASVSIANAHTAAIRSDGALFTWGDNTYGELGNNTIIAVTSPIQIGTSSWSMVSAGGLHTIAIQTNGLLFGWGNNGSGQLGIGNTINQSSPVQIGSAASWKTISANSNSTFAIKATGELFACGYNGNGVLGTGDTVSYSSLVQIGASSWSMISIGGGDTTYSPIRNMTCGITTTGSLFAWGSNGGGQLGDGSITSRSSPVQIGLNSWNSVSSSTYHYAAIRIDGALFTCGYNQYGQLGDGTIVSKSSLIQIGTSSWNFISAGKNSTAAITTNNTLYTWGINSGNLGDGTTVNKSSPVQIGSNNNWISISISKFTSSTVAIASNNALFAWGDNANGQLGIADGAQSSPIQVGTSSWTMISTGLANCAAIRTDGALFTWGINTYGQGGIGSLTSQIVSPTQIGTSSWTMVSAKGETLFAIDINGKLFAVGRNSYGEMAQGYTSTYITSPTQIGTSSWTSVWAGHNSAAAIRTDGALFTWGYNGNGGLGDGTSVDKSSPVQIGTNSWSMVSIGGGAYYVGGLSMHAIRSDGKLFSWGRNTSGQLGLGDTTNRSSPVQVGTSTWNSVSDGYAGFTLAIKNDNLLFGWGNNTYGQLGINRSGTNYSAPVQIGYSKWSLISAGGYANYYQIKSGVYKYGGGTSVGTL